MRDIRDRMRLQAWDIEVVEQPADDGSALDIKPDSRIWWARVRVGSFFQNNDDIRNTPEEQRQTVVHELLHLTQADLLGWLERGQWKTPLSMASSGEMEERIVTEVEKFTDFAARLLAPQYPLPPEWPD